MQYFRTYGSVRRGGRQQPFLPRPFGRKLRNLVAVQALLISAADAQQSKSKSLGQ